MKFTELFAVKLIDSKTAEWFDPILNLDTKLFVDPFLIYDREFKEFEGSHNEIVEFFQVQFELIAKAKGDRKSQSWKKAEYNLLFPEVEELCLGYTASGTSGAGSGKDIAKQISTAINAAIRVGVNNLDHFEEIQLFQEGISRDRISDATAKILFHRFAKYTERQCKRLKIETKKSHFERVRFDQKAKRWVSGIFDLPQNPYNGKPILLCPKFYLRTEPTINPDGFWDYVRASEPDILRTEFGGDIVGHLNKSLIVEIALKYPEARTRYIRQQEDEGAVPYDINDDPKVLIKWYFDTLRWIEKENPKIDFKTKNSFSKFVRELIEIFTNYVENQGGWKLLWNDNDTARSEESAQNLFLGIVMHACRANDIDISKEANIGRGPVDFKVSKGYKYRALIELKLARNSKFWNGLSKQLPKYLQAENIAIGHFLVVCYTDKDLKKISNLESRTKSLAKELPYQLTSSVVDAAQDKPSASKLTH